MAKGYARIKAKIRAHDLVREVKYRLILEATLAGALTGAVVSVFRLILSYADEFRTAVIDGARESGGGLAFALAILAVFAVCVALALKKEPMISGSGIPQVKGELLGIFNSDWLKVLVLKFLGGICAITAGLSLGREGPSIQLGAMVGKGITRLSPKFEKDKNVLMIAGAGAGLSAAFSAPLAGVIFTMEELKKTYSTDLMISVMAAAITSDWMASYIFGLQPVFSLNVTYGLGLRRYWEIVLLGILLGLFGALYNKGIALAQDMMKQLKPVVRILMAAGAIIVLAAWYPQALGSGHSLVSFAGEGGHGLRVMLILLMVKFIFSVFSFGTGAPGGIFLPLLVLGAVSGGVFSEAAARIFGFDAVYVSLFVVLGMAGLFSAIVKAPLTGIVLISEMTGIMKNLLPLAIVSFTAYIVSEFCGAIPVYDQLLKRMINERFGDEEDPEETGERHLRAR